MYVLYEFLVLRAEPDLADRLAETLQRDPVAALVALDLLREDAQIELLSRPTLLALSGELASFSTERRVAVPTEVDEDRVTIERVPHTMSFEVTGQTQQEQVSLDLRMEMAEGERRLERDMQVIIAAETWMRLDVPDLFVAVRPSILASSDQGREVLEARAEMRQERLDEVGVKGARSRRKAIEGLLVKP